ncbi:hypothetical protein RCG23_20905 [Neobacillus sp. PS3-34]|uniref:hypothetical protein n=1 Tax=Neobacillus sp. PS3-34 TaxID=3070678 RepID=UPI0027DECEA4|nr:hypothetical protein [Neobacillus sp. PS3-34]WML47769.1 hypothetical protein RCG23_20905 [Neobacillus sp. PS3-34]
MFDPTAFDNLKVVLEGTLYDKDLNEELVIADRNDTVNLAKLSRSFDFLFYLAGEKQNYTQAKLLLESKLENLASELLPGTDSSHLSGCRVQLYFYLEHKNKHHLFSEIQDILTEIWGPERKITQSIQLNPLKNDEFISNTISVNFDRMIYEDQIKDLIDMIDYMMDTLNKLDEWSAKQGGKNDSL